MTTALETRKTIETQTGDTERYVAWVLGREPEHPGPTRVEATVASRSRSDEAIVETRFGSCDSSRYFAWLQGRDEAPRPPATGHAARASVMTGPRERVRSVADECGDCEFGQQFVNWILGTGYAAGRLPPA